MTRRLAVPAAAVLLVALAGCGGRGEAARPAPAPSARPSAGSSALTSQDVAAVEQAVRQAGDTLGQADQALAGD